MTYRRKLIEVALPLEAINEACQNEKYNPFLKGHPRSLHHWWARRPLAACRAVLWSSLVDDPSEYIKDETSANTERERLFKVLEELVMWENSNNEEVLEKAKLEIARSVARNLGEDLPVGKEAIEQFLRTKAPPVLDPFAGGGSIPLEAQRLGLRSFASDLNPVAVLINKGLIEIPPKFAGYPPLHPIEEHQEKQAQLFQNHWKGAQGLAEDIRFYGNWLREEAEKKVGRYYPKIKLTVEMISGRTDLKNLKIKPGDELAIEAWIWTRTITCPNPICKLQTPLIKSFWLSNGKGKKYWVSLSLEKPIKNEYSFDICFGEHDHPGKGTVGRSGAYCISCHTPISLDYIRTQGKEKKIGIKLMAVVATTSDGKRVYLPPTKEQESIAGNIKPKWEPDEKIPHNPFALRPPLYGLEYFSDLYTQRQLLTLTTYCDLTIILKDKILNDLSNNHTTTLDKNTAKEYAASIITYLALAISQLSRYSVSTCTWNSTNQNIVHTFTRPAIPMTWDFAETNPIEGKLTLQTTSSWVASAIENLGWQNAFGLSELKNAAENLPAGALRPMIVTDPPYYDNIDYADLSDFFYVWLRPCLQTLYPEVFTTVLTPKSQELVATPYRFDGDRGKAEENFLNGLQNAFNLIREKNIPEYPISIFYAYKQTEEQTDAVDDQQLTLSSTGWETMLEGLLGAGYLILGTWPMHTERPVGVKGWMNSLASSIVLVCRPRPNNAANITRREFLVALKKELAPALRQLQLGNIAPVDFAQAAIGPGMAVFSRYRAVLESEGSPMVVRTALSLINQSLDEYLTEQEGEYDSDTRWALAWYEQFGHNEAAYGVAETLSKAKNTSVQGLAEAGILEARGGKVHLFSRDELDTDWDPEKDKRLTAWESVQHLIFALDQNGEEAAATLLSHLGSMSETARDLAYRLYTICERKGWAQDALAYNMLVVAWPRLKELVSRQEPAQKKLL